MTPGGGDPENVLEITAESAVDPQLLRWASVWFDLLQVDTALDARRALPNNEVYIFHRRALWEAAVVAYGRMPMSKWVRQVDFDALLDDLRGNARELHNRILDWRHGHVAHRRDSEFEEVQLVAAFYGHESAETLGAVRARIAVSIGPRDDDEFVVQFKHHVKALRDRIWETRLAPLTVSLVQSMQADVGAVGLVAREFVGLPGHDDASLGAVLTLWSNVNGTGVGTAGQ